MLILFCLRDEKGDEQTLQWYADLLGSARRIACVSFAFNLDDFFKEVLLKDAGVLHYAVFDKNPGMGFENDIQRIRNTVIAPGAKLGEGDMVNFLAEKLTGFNKNLYIHDKFILVDPLGTDPIVVTGTANFSRPSQNANDENMLVIRGSKRVADIYFGEFMRIFDHLYSRYIVRKLQAAGKNDPDAGYLKEDWQAWVPQHFKDGPKQLRRRFFMEE
jgi:phosphatidylserine/phosphatidylglycerophosphate/cardiolipin synthase-like enzyme